MGTRLQIGAISVGARRCRYINRYNIAAFVRKDDMRNLAGREKGGSSGSGKNKGPAGGECAPRIIGLTYQGGNNTREFLNRWYVGGGWDPLRAARP
jgi:hypothetical protein